MGNNPVVVDAKNVADGPGLQRIVQANNKPIGEYLLPNTIQSYLLRRDPNVHDDKIKLTDKAA